MTQDNDEPMILVPIAFGLIMFLVVCLGVFKQIYDSGKIEIRDKEVELGVDYEIIQNHAEGEENELHD